MSGGHREPPARALELEDLRALDIEVDLLGDGAPGLAELQCRDTVAVNARVHVGRFRVEARPHDQPHLAVRVRAGAQELRGGLNEEIALHLLPRELVLVMVGPHVGAGRGHEVLLGVPVEGGAARDCDPADVGMLVEYADGGRLVGCPG